MKLWLLIPWTVLLFFTLLLQAGVVCQSSFDHNRQKNGNDVDSMATDGVGASPTGEHADDADTDDSQYSGRSFHPSGLPSNGTNNSVVVEGDLNEKNTPMKIEVDTTTPNLPFPIPPGILVMFTDSVRVVRVNYTLACHDLPRSQHVLYVVLRQISHQRTARLSAQTSLNVSCQQQQQHHGDTGAHHPTVGTSDGHQVSVSDSFHFTISSNLLGKSVLLFYLQSAAYSPPDAFNGPYPPDFKQRRPFGVGHTASPSSQQLLLEDSVWNSTAATAGEGTLSQPSLSSSSSPPTFLVHKTVLLVLRRPHIIHQIFNIAIYIFIVSATIGMGCKTELAVVKAVLKKPSVVLIGFSCQYICMPLIAYGVARTMKLGNMMASFGIFACGVCPGGGMSNMFSYLLGGDLSLSITLTVISTVASMGMIPFWLFTLGKTLDLGGQKLNIPYLKITETLTIIVLPLFFGLFLQYRFPKVAKIILKVLKPMMLVAILFLLSVGIYANLYIFRLFDPLTILAGCMLPYIGYVTGGIVSLICRQPWDRVKTIALETGIQNVKLAFLILIFSLPPPDGELAAVGPAASAVMTGIPPLLLSLAYIAYNKVKGKPLPGRQAEAEAKAKRAMLDKQVTIDAPSFGIKTSQGERDDVSLEKAQTVYADLLRDTAFDKA